MGHPRREGVRADGAGPGGLLHGSRRRWGALGGPFRRRALVWVPGGATGGGRGWGAAPFGTRRPRCVVELVDEPVAAAAGAGFDLSAGAGGVGVDVGGGTTQAAAGAGWGGGDRGELAAARETPGADDIQPVTYHPRHGRR